MTEKKTTLQPVKIENYEITGFYYQIGEYNFRKYLDIKFKCCKADSPDLMVIMMNPGSSAPLDSNDDGRVEINAKPDPTQTQIIRVMESLNFNYARILNLSDLRQPNSNVFYGQISSMNEDCINHSIFHESRLCDFKKLYIKGVPVLYAWGTNKKLNHLAKCALKATKLERSFGWRKPKFDFAYYHPLPRGYIKQIKWYESIIIEFNNENNTNQNT
jgi:hypothetical protein